MMLSIEKSNDLKFQTDWLILAKVMSNLVANLQYRHQKSENYEFNIVIGVG